MFCHGSSCVWRHWSKIWSTATFQWVPLAVQLWWAVSVPRAPLTPLFSRFAAIKHYTTWFSCPAAAADCCRPDLVEAKSKEYELSSTCEHPNYSANVLKYLRVGVWQRYVLVNSIMNIFFHPLTGLTLFLRNTFNIYSFMFLVIKIINYRGNFIKL